MTRTATRRLPILLLAVACSPGAGGAADVPVGAPDAADGDTGDAPAGTRMSRLRADGTRIVDEGGHEVRLRGVNLGGWLFHETWITLVGQTSHGALYEAARARGLGGPVREAMRAVGIEFAGDAGVHVCPGHGDAWVQKLRPHLVQAIGEAETRALLDVLAERPPLCDDADLGLRRVLSQRFGTDGRDRLLDAFQRAWLTEDDIAWIAGQGFNVVRVPIGYRSLVRGPDEDRPARLDWNPLAFERLSELLDWCERHGVYAVVDIQEAPGGQNTYAGEAGLFTDPRMQDLTVAMWEHLSDVLRDRNEVAAYSLLAEPYGAPDAAARDAMYDRLVKAIRARGDDHLLVIHDGFFGMNTMPDPSAHGWTGVVYSTHLFEWAAKDLDAYRVLFEGLYGPTFRTAQEAQGTPIYIGSFSTFYDQPWAYDAAGYVAGWAEENGWSWSLWTYKRPDDPVTLEVFGLSTGWGLRGRLNGPFRRPDPYADDFATLEAAFDAYRDLEVAPNQSLLSAIRSAFAVGAQPR